MLFETQDRQSLIGVIEGTSSLIAFLDSAWMQWMWVTLEYCQCKAASILNQKNQIWR